MKSKFKKNKNTLPSARPQHSAKGLFAECQVKRSVNIFFKDGNGVGGVGGQLTGILPSALFAECCARQRVPLFSGVLCRAPGTLRHSANHSLPSAILCRVPYFRHSAKHAALDKFCFSRSVQGFNKVDQHHSHASSGFMVPPIHMTE